MIENPELINYEQSQKYKTLSNAESKDLKYYKSYESESF